MKELLVLLLLHLQPPLLPATRTAPPLNTTISTPSLSISVSAEGNVTAVTDRATGLNRVLDTHHKLLYAYFAGGAQAGVTSIEQSGSTLVASFASMGSATVTIDVGISSGDLIAFRVVGVTGPSALQQLDFLTLPLQSKYCARPADVPGDELGMGAYDDAFGVLVSREKQRGGSGGSLEPPGLFLAGYALPQSIPCIWLF
jgi:hypothetical protein